MQHHHVDSPAGALHCTVQGKGPWVVLSHSLACDLRMWDAQARHLQDRFTVLRYDTRGHGQSAAAPAPYTIEALAGDVVRLLDHFGVQRAHVVGLSLGGLIAQSLAARQPQRVDRLVLADTTCLYPPASKGMWADRVRIAREQGMEPLVAPTLERWFTAPFRQRAAAEVDRIAAMIRGTQVEGYAGCCQALSAADLREDLARIDAPTLVVVGAQDGGTTPDMARDLHQRIAGSRLELVDEAAHLSNVEQPVRFNALLDGFLA